MDYIIRNEDEEEMKINYSGTTLSNFLKSKYGYIYDSMKANGYEINLDGFNLFFELIHDKKSCWLCNILRNSGINNDSNRHICPAGFRIRKFAF